MVILRLLCEMFRVCIEEPGGAVERNLWFGRSRIEDLSGGWG